MKSRLPRAVAARPLGSRDPRATPMAMKQASPARYQPSDGERVVGRLQAVDGAPTTSTTAAADACPARRRGRPRWPTISAGADARGPEAAQHALLPLGGEVHGDRDEAQRGEDDADVAGDVVVARARRRRTRGRASGRTRRPAPAR